MSWGKNCTLVELSKLLLRIDHFGDQQILTDRNKMIEDRKQLLMAFHCHNIVHSVWMLHHRDFKSMTATFSKSNQRLASKVSGYELGENTNYTKYYYF